MSIRPIHSSILIRMCTYRRGRIESFTLFSIKSRLRTATNAAANKDLLLNTCRLWNELRCGKMGPRKDVGQADFGGVISGDLAE